MPLQFRVKVTGTFDVSARDKITGHDLEDAESCSERWFPEQVEVVLQTREVGPQPDPLFYREGKAIPLRRSDIWDLIGRGFLRQIE